ncbi:hypothetical protein FDW81_00090 [Pseudarthrobacter sp. NamB4]|nr:hypothetical protein FDW81_00090 [Pseudarthrobacter sp. NamB4]
MAATAADAASWSRCCGPQPRGRLPGSGEGDAVAWDGVVRSVGVGDAEAEGDDGDGVGPGAAVQEARATAEAAARRGKGL